MTTGDDDDLFAASRGGGTAAGGDLGTSTLPPLAARMRPRSLDEVRGQGDVLRPGSPLRRLIDGSAGAAGPLSAIIWGPPGTGKTTLAHLVATAAGRRFVELSAVTAGVKDVRAVMDQAARRARPVRPRRRCCSSTRSTGSPRPSRTPCSPAWRTGWSSSSPPRPRTRRSASSRRCCRARCSSPCGPLDDDELDDVLTAALEQDRGLAGELALEPRGAGAHHPDGRRRRAAGPDRAGGGGRRRAGRGAGRAHGRRAVADHARPGGAGRRPRRGALRPGRRPALRRGQRADQVDARQRRRRRAALPGPDAGGGGGPAVHRPPHRHRRQRGRRHGRPDRAADRRRRRCTPSRRSACRRRGSSWRRPWSTTRSRRSRTPAMPASTPRSPTSGPGKVGPVPPHLRGSGYAGAKPPRARRGLPLRARRPAGVVAQQYLPDDLVQSATYYRPTDRGFEERLGPRWKWLRELIRGR